MSREVRMVPANWEHPKREDGSYIPLFDANYEAHAAQWDKDCADWNNGKYPDWADEDHKELSFEEWDGERPNAEDYMPTFAKGEATHYMMYETTSEGTPISPAFKTPEELARWLVDNNASAFGSQTGTYGGWL